MIIALQRAASTPSEITKQNLYQSIEDLYRIYIEFMAANYGKRYVDVSTPQEVNEAFAFVEQQAPAEIPVEYDFSQLRDLPINIKLDVGASSYYSEIASINTLDNLLQQGKISPKQYLERIPDGYIPDRRKLVEEIRQQEAAMQAQMVAQQPQTPPQDGEVVDQGEKESIPTGGGYSALQRKVNEAGTTAGIV